MYFPSFHSTPNPTNTEMFKPAEITYNQKIYLRAGGVPV
jgi:hypothetical protein